MDKLTTIQNLVDKLNYHTKLYDEGHPEITDKQWDDLYFELVKLERASGIYLNDSPTQRVNYQVVNELTKVQHSHPMLSLNKTKSLDELNTFIKGKQYILMAKMDGLTCSLKYKNGFLVGAETRGNGIEGENILHNAMAVKSIPKRIPYTGEFTVDGEIICTYQDFEPFKEEYANPRNFASGSIRLLDAKESALRNLTFVAWDIIGDIENVDCLSQKLEYLIKQGFLIVPYYVHDDYVNEEMIEALKKECHIYKYPIDGLVIKYDYITTFEACGRTDHHFKGGLAYKFYDEEYETYLKNIEWTMGRTGILTPVAIFEPVDTGDSVIERASLHNVSIMKDLLWRPYKGQSLMVCKMNDIIPQVVSAGREISPADFEGLELIIPTVCPICGGTLEIVCEVDSEILVCTNDACMGQAINRIEHFCSKKGLDIKGLSKATLTKLWDWGWVHEPADLYTLHNFTKEWVTKPGFGAKSVENILTAIDYSTYPKLENFICALGIPHVGTTLSRELVKYFTTYEEFRDAAKDKWDFTQIDKVGYEKASAIWNFDFAEADRVAAYMQGYEKDAPAAADSTLDATTVVITGKLALHKNRDELVKRIIERGGKVTGSVSKNTHILINNDVNSTSSKNVSAQRLGIPIMTEEEFVNLYLS
jgi:DNA ligase (NAD+)